MAFFGLSDISFNKGSAERSGPLAPLVNAPFQQNLLRYPLDVGNYDKGHYMVFYIRQQKNTKYVGSLAPENALNGTSSTPAANVPIQTNPTQSKYSNSVRIKY
jgi:hypothetical protein